MLTILEVLKRTTEYLEKHGVESARLNGELLLGHALGLSRMELYLQFERPLTDPELERIRPLVKRRGGREPLQYILGEVEFAGLKLKVDRRALIPRPETELLVETIKAHVTSPPATILDLGTGSGALAFALAKTYPTAEVTAVDASREALELAGENAMKAGLSSRVHLLHSDWCSNLVAGQRFDLIVSNPPYLGADELGTAQPEVKGHEPRAALVSGEGGLADLKVILRQAREFLNHGGLLACETGAGQHDRLRSVAADRGYTKCLSLPDLAGQERFLLAFV